MLQRNSLKSTYLNAPILIPIIYKSRYIIAMLVGILLIAGSCKKSRPPDYIANVYEQYFETNILNTDFKVKLAVDTGRDITAQYTDYKFRLLKNTFYDGPLKVTRISDPAVVYSGTWSSNEDFSKLVISITSASPPEFIFLNREWKFTKKALPVMELAPWGTTEAKVLHMERL